MFKIQACYANVQCTIYSGGYEYGLIGWYIALLIDIKWKTNTNSLCPNSSESKPLNFFEITNNQKWLNSSSSLKNSTFVFQILNLSLYNMRIMRDRIGSNPILQTFTNFHTGTVYWFYYLWQHFLKQCTTMTIYTWSWKVK